MTSRQTTATRGRQRPPARDDREVDELLARYRVGRDRSIRNEIIEAHRWLANVIARRFSHRGEPIDDLVQVATIGILKAVERFDPSFGVAFRTYASSTAQGEVRRHYRDTTWRMRVPRQLQERYLDVNAALDRLTGVLGHSPTVDDLATHLHLHPDQVIEAIWVGTNYRPVPLTATSADTEDHTADGGASEDEISSGWDEAFERLLTTVEMRAAMAELPSRERRIVFMRYFEERTQTEIAESVGLSQVHVSRLLRSAVARLRDRIPKSDGDVGSIDGESGSQPT
ncbi:MAG: sigma-70 family RNA polymerase sigma factor [Acidimicrobiia bacterium]